MRVLFIWERERGECSEKKQVILEVSNKDTSLPTALGRGNGLGKAGKTPGVGEPPSQWGTERLCASIAPRVRALH